MSGLAKNVAFLTSKQHVDGITLPQEIVEQLGLPIIRTDVDYIITDINSIGNTTVTPKISEKIYENSISSSTVQDSETVLYQIVYPEELDLVYTPSVQSPPAKRGRPKRKQKVTEEITDLGITEIIKSSLKTTRTRSGRLVKAPKHMKKDYKKIEISDEPIIKISEFERNEDLDDKPVPDFKTLNHHQRHRTIAAQYQCPKCQKKYLGKNKMMQHITKNPDHGPVPEQNKDLNFDVWNHLVDITQKCPPGQRGSKFCKEITNLLHNLKLLTSALFKSVSDNKHCVQVDKVLGCAIGLPPGKYMFDENELYKDVTVLKLFTNTDFFKLESNNFPINDSNNFKTNNQDLKVSLKKDNDISKPHELTALKDQCKELDVDVEMDSFPNSVSVNNFGKLNINISNNSFKDDKSDIQNSVPVNAKKNVITNYKRPNDNNLDNRLILTENLLLNSHPHIRNTVDDLILTAVDTGSGSNLLDNSTSLDEVMNVDQFVNERFKKITEPDVELSSSSLNLDLPSMDLFEFNTN